MRNRPGPSQKPVAVTDADGDQFVFKSADHAAAGLGVSTRTVQDYCKGRTDPANSNNGEINRLRFSYMDRGTFESSRGMFEAVAA